MSLALEEGRFLKVTGHCMKRTIPRGALVRVSHCSRFGLVPGDVVLMEDAGGFYLHRYLLRTGLEEGGALLTKGDEAVRPDPFSHPSRLMGRMVEMKLGGRVVAYRPSLSERARAVVEGYFWLAFLLLKAARRGLPLFS